MKIFEFNLVEFESNRFRGLRFGDGDRITSNSNAVVGDSNARDLFPTSRAADLDRDLVDSPVVLVVGCLVGSGHGRSAALEKELSARPVDPFSERHRLKTGDRLVGVRRVVFILLLRSVHIETALAQLAPPIVACIRGIALNVWQLGIERTASFRRRTLTERGINIVSHK